MAGLSLRRLGGHMHWGLSLLSIGVALLLLWWFLRREARQRATTRAEVEQLLASIREESRGE